jgi:CrcB protein
MLKLIVIGLGGFVGAIARYGLSGYVHRSTNASFPVGTLAVNALGCLVIGALMVVVEEKSFSPNVRLFLLIGLLGSFTTFSTLGYETFDLLKEGAWKFGALNIALNMILGLGCVMIGRISTKLILP